MPKPVYRRIGLSQVVPYIRGEDPQERHRRRLRAAESGVRSVQAWCEGRGIACRVTPGDGYPAFKWDFRLPDRFAQWRPLVGKLVMKRTYSGDLLHVKVHDCEQLLRVLEEWRG